MRGTGREEGVCEEGRECPGKDRGAREREGKTWVGRAGRETGRGVGENREPGKEEVPGKEKWEKKGRITGERGNQRGEGRARGRQRHQAGTEGNLGKGEAWGIGRERETREGTGHLEEKGALSGGSAPPGKRRRGF